jgi:hypothetical protein
MVAGRIISVPFLGGEARGNHIIRTLSVDVLGRWANLAGFKKELDLNGGIQREGIDADGGADMLSWITE